VKNRPRPLPVRPRPRPGETTATYIQQLALANHLPERYLRSYLSATAATGGHPDLNRLAAVSGRAPAVLQRALTDLTCAHCGTPLTAKHKGRTARWCSPACGLRGLRRRKRGKPERGEPAAPRTACRRCGARISQKPTGRPAEWCSHTCWKRDHRQQLKAAAEI
jgi:hypothetical protein